MPATGITWEVQSPGFLPMVNELSRLSGKTFEHVLVDQTGALLKVCLRNTPAAHAGGIIKRASRSNNHVEFNSGEIVSFWKKADALMFLDDSTWKPHKGQEPPRTIGGKSWHLMESSHERRHWSDARWAKWRAFDALAEKKKVDVKTALKSRGLAKQSWLQIAEQLGIAEKLDAPDYVKNARPSDGQHYQNGTAQRILDAASIFIEIRNDNPIVVNKLNGAQILSRAIAQRERAYLIETQKGVFDDIKTRAQRYPGIFTNN